MKPEFRIQIYSELYLEWYNFPHGDFDNKEKAIAAAIKVRKDWSRKNYKVRLVEMCEKVIRLPKKK